MGWGTGTSLMQDIVIALNEKFPDDAELRKQIYHILITEFENYDADNLCEIDDDEIFKAAFDEINPPEIWEQDEDEY